MMKKIVISLFFALLLTGCATELDRIAESDSIGFEDAYITGLFKDENHFSFLSLFNKKSPFSVTLKRVDDGKLYTFNFRTDDLYQIFPIPAGEYTVSSIYRTETEKKGNNYETTTINVEIPDDLKFPFYLEEGKICYLGDIIITTEEFMKIFTRDISVYFYNYDEAVRKIGNQYSNIDLDDIVSLE